MSSPDYADTREIRVLLAIEAPSKILQPRAQAK
jgi:hypothetical protein